MCEYCKGSFVGDVEPKNFGNNIIELYIDRGFLYSFHSSGSELVKRIEYCPFCGEPFNDQD